MIITEYHRPTTLQEALTLLGRSDVVSRPLGGGTLLNGLPDQVPDAVVDLQALDLDGIDLTNGTVTLGAMTTLNSMSKSEAVPGVLRELARGEAPSTIRNVATVGGTVGGRDGLSGLLAGLLAFGAVVELAIKDLQTCEPCGQPQGFVELCRLINNLSIKCQIRPDPDVWR